MMIDLPPPPDDKRTRLEHPKLALAKTSAQLRGSLMILIAIMALGGLYFLKLQSKREQQEIVQEKQLTEQQRAAQVVEISATLMKAYKGEITQTTQAALVNRVGTAIAQKSDAKNTATKLSFHLLAEENAINLFALPNGEVFVTTALVNRMKTEGQLAAALAHGIAHGMTGDMPEPLATQPTPPNVPLWTYTVAQERASDVLALTLMSQAGYDPNAMIGLFGVLTDAYQTKAEVGFFVTHPNERERLQQIQNAITALYPSGIPPELSQ